MSVGIILFLSTFFSLTEMYVALFCLWLVVYLLGVPLRQFWTSIFGLIQR